ncbi:hypothetical protein [Nonomuraea rhodomycinica]|uniref:Uncharacterized protein n=1 Tax=Nonomuraea rhodomycinica TaxID=1712872 RepID=A0A7Y6IQW4_9ACTN|nr:hypothetical protein [Nonomuraea rhodomycinica]NUW42293.1 hypothetical protein [Nonomuraea rhodomycinica]
MRTINKTLTLAAVSLLSAATLQAPAAHAATAGTATGCPAPSRAEIKRSYEAKEDKPAKGATALRGVHVGYIPKGFTHGQVVAQKHDGVTEYGYQWTADRSDIDLKRRFLWVRVVCWPGARELADLKKLPVTLGTFTSGTKTRTIGGRQVLTKPGDGALGAGRYAGWVEREGVVVTVMAGRPHVGNLDQIIGGVKVS